MQDWHRRLPNGYPTQSKQLGPSSPLKLVTSTELLHGREGGRGGLLFRGCWVGGSRVLVVVVGLQDLHLHWYGLELGSGPPTRLWTTVPLGGGGGENGHGCLRSVHP